MLENGADMRYVQSMLGHDCIVSTQVYTELSIRQLKKLHATTHPAVGEAFGDFKKERKKGQKKRDRKKGQAK
jgi:predicted nucleic acid-binding protein